MSTLKEYTQNVAKDNTEFLRKIRAIQNDVASLTNSLDSLATDVESNALAIEEIGEIIGGGE